MQTLLDKRLQRLNRIKLVFLVIELVLLVVSGMYVSQQEGSPTVMWAVNFGLLMIAAGAHYAVSSRIDKSSSRRVGTDFKVGRQPR